MINDAYLASVIQISNSEDLVQLPRVDGLKLNLKFDGEEILRACPHLNEYVCYYYTQATLNPRQKWLEHPCFSKQMTTFLAFVAFYSN